MESWARERHRDRGQCSTFSSGLGCSLLEMLAPQGRLCTSMRGVGRNRPTAGPVAPQRKLDTPGWLPGGLYLHLFLHLWASSYQTSTNSLKSWNSPFSRTGLLRPVFHRIWKGRGIDSDLPAASISELALLSPQPLRLPTWKWLW